MTRDSKLVSFTRMIHVWLREKESPRPLKDAIPGPLHEQVKWHTVKRRSEFAGTKPALVVHHPKGETAKAEWFAAGYGLWVHYLPEACALFQDKLAEMVEAKQPVHVFSTELRKVTAQ